MCGIAGFHLKDPKFVKRQEGIEKLVNKLLLGIESRGKHATGFVAVTFDGKTQMDKAAVEATEFIKNREAIPKGVQTALLHTRWATKGPKEDHRNNHPVLFKTCFAIHNGHINNDDALFAEFELERSAEVDSIAIPAIIDKFGFDKLPEALEKFHGNMATAIIDPVKHPKMLVLARGETSPLVTIENDHFIMWASTTMALRDAWAEVLGTPPAWNKFQTEKEGTLIVVNDTEVTRSEFKVARPFGFRGKGNSEGSTTGNTGSAARRNAGSNAQSNDVEADAVIASKTEIIAFVKSDEATARRWAKKDSYTDKDWEDLSDTRLKRWIPCYGCDDLVIHEDMRKTLNWGTICIDCHKVVVKAVERKMREDQDEDGDTLAGTDIPRIAAVDRDALESWSQQEVILHNATLEEVSKRVGSYYTPRLIEFLIFLTTSEYRLMAGSRVVELIDRLRDMYEETYVGVQEDNWNNGEPSMEDDPADTQVIPLALPRGGSGDYPAQSWGYCHTHKEPYRVDLGCVGCAAPEGNACGVEAFERTPAPAGEVIELSRCPECNTYILREGGRKCSVCAQLQATDGGGTEDGGAEPERQLATGKCMKCGHKARVILRHKNGGTVSYCKKHYKTCHKCDVDANHVLATGERRCHVHVRNTSGALSDKTLIKRGAEIVEVD